MTYLQAIGSEGNKEGGNPVAGAAEETTSETLTD